MRDRVIVKIQRRDFGNTRSDAYVLQAEQQKYGPDEVEKLRSQHQRAKGRFGRNPLRSERYPEVTDEHGASLAIAGVTVPHRGRQSRCQIILIVGSLKKFEEMRLVLNPIAAFCR